MRPRRTAWPRRSAATPHAPGRARGRADARRRPGRARRRRPGRRRAHRRRSRQPRHAPAQRGGIGGGGNPPRSHIGRRLQSQSRSGVGWCVLRGPDPGGCPAVEALGARSASSAGVRRVGAVASRRDVLPKRSTSPGPPRSCSATRPTGSTRSCPLDDHGARSPWPAGRVAERRDGRHRAPASKRPGSAPGCGNDRRSCSRSKAARTSSTAAAAISPPPRLTDLDERRARAARQGVAPQRHAQRRSRTLPRPTNAAAGQGDRRCRRGAELDEVVERRQRRARDRAPRRSCTDRLDLTLGGRGYRARPPPPRHAQVWR